VNVIFILGFKCWIVVNFCHNHSLGFTTKAKTCKGEGQEGSPGVTFHALGSVGKCEGMNRHTPKCAPTLGIKIPMDSWIFKERLQRSKPIRLRSSLHHWKISWNVDD
jgi:hypothetical protein